MADAAAGESARARELANQGYLERLWALRIRGTLSAVPGQDSPETEAIVKALSLDLSTTTDLTPLTPHPSDAATMST